MIESGRTVGSLVWVPVLADAVWVCEGTIRMLDGIQFVESAEVVVCVSVSVCVVVGVGSVEEVEVVSSAGVDEGLEI